MPKPEWGTKRLCHSCGTQYYDFNKDEPICPNCGADFAPENILKISRGVEEPSKKAAPKPMKEEEIDSIEDDDSEESYIEDPEELGDDGDVIAVASDDDRQDS